MNPTAWLLPAGRLRRMQLIGFACSSGIALAGVGTGALKRIGGRDVIASELHLLFLRQSPGWRGACTVVSFLSLFGLLAAWAIVGRSLAQCSRRHLMVLCVTWGLPLLLAPPLFSADIFAYVGQGHLIVNDIDPYRYGPGDFEPTSKWSFNVDGVWQFSPAPYGPLWLWLSAQAVGIPENHLVVSIYLVRALAVVGFVLLGWALIKLTARADVPAERALWLVLLNPLLLLHGLAGAHNDLLMVGLLAAGFAVTSQHPGLRGIMAGTALVTLAALIKAPALVAIPFIPLIARRQRPAWSLVLTAATVGVVAEAVALATRLGWGWVTVLSHQGEKPGIWSVAWGLRRATATTTKAVFGADAASTADTTVKVLFLSALALLLFGIWVHALRGRVDPVTGAGVALIGLFLLGFSVQPWYLAWGLVPLATTSTRRRAAQLASFSGALSLYLLPGGRNWIRPPLYGLPVLLALVGAYFLTTWLAQSTQGSDPLAEAPLLPVE